MEIRPERSQRMGTHHRRRRAQTGRKAQAHPQNRAQFCSSGCGVSSEKSGGPYVVNALAAGADFLSDLAHEGGLSLSLRFLAPVVHRRKGTADAAVPG
jgi:hypothetical protein